MLRSIKNQGSQRAAGAAGAAGGAGGAEWMNGKSLLISVTGNPCNNVQLEPLQPIRAVLKMLNAPVKTTSGQFSSQSAANQQLAPPLTELRDFTALYSLS